MEPTTPVSEVGENRLIERVAARLAPAPPGEIWTGDDAALVRAGSTGGVLLTVDVLVQGVDFDPASARGRDLGWKAITVNVSDIAAMGGRPTYAVAALCLEPSTTLGFVDELCDGIVAAAGEYALHLVGGDISSAGELSIAVTLLGAAPGPVVRRSGARIDDALCVTGALGGAAAGLRSLREDSLDPGDPQLDRQLRPRARVDEGVAIAAAGATAMIDVSDGLAIDLARLCDASGVGCAVDSDAIPIDTVARSLEDPLEAALTGGEDFELLFTLPPGTDVPAGATRIGTVVEGDRTIDSEPLRPWEDKGWEHLTN